MFTITQDLHVSANPIQPQRRFNGTNKVEFEIRVKAIKVDSSERYYDSDGQLHCENGPAWVEGDNKQWYKHGKLHRDDGPAVIIKNRKYWYLDGEKKK